MRIGRLEIEWLNYTNTPKFFSTWYNNRLRIGRLVVRLRRRG